MRSDEMILKQAVQDLLADLGATGVPLIQGGTDTEVLTGDAIAVKRWSTKLWVELPRVIYWNRFMRENDMNAVIEVKTDLEKGPGDTINFTLLRKLTGAGASGDNAMENNEEVMAPFNDSCVLDQTRNAIRLKGKLSERRTAWSQREAAKQLLKTWMAETIDDSIFTKLDTSPTTVLFGGSATSTATIDASSKLTPTLIDKLVAKAKKALPKIWPVQVAGRQLYVLVVNTDVTFDLRQSAIWSQAQREANIRGDENPIFNGMIGFYNGVIIHEHEKVPIAVNWGSDSLQTGASNMFLGRQAGVFAWGQKPQWWEKEFDYGNRTGFCIGAIWDFEKAIFGGSDHGYIAARTYRTNV